MTPLIRFAIWLYQQLLRLYPRRFRAQFAKEMGDVFRKRVQQTARAGSRATLAVLGRELRDWPLNCLHEHIQERNHARLIPPPASLSAWGGVAAALPFLFYFVSFNPALYRILPPVFLVGALLAAWWHHWPGWVVSWLGFVIVLAQNWLPYSLLGNAPSWNSVPRLLYMLVEVAIQTSWLVVVYGVVRRWPRQGTLAFLPFLLLPWAFSMEFASEAMTTVVTGAALLILALTAMAISRQRSATGDVWLLLGGGLLAGGTVSLGAVFFSPGMETAWRRILPNLMQALAPFVCILLLQSLTSWSRDNGRAAQRRVRLMAWGTLLAWMALLALVRLAGPSDLERFQLGMVPVLLAVWLLGVLLILSSGWQLRASFAPFPKWHAAGVTLLLVLFPLLHRPGLLAGTFNSLVYDQATLAHLRRFIPALQTADLIITIAGVVGLLLLPQLVGELRRQTAGFPTLAAGRHERGQTKTGNGPAAPRLPWQQRLAVRVLLVLLLAGCGFFAVVFLPLQLQAEPYTRQIVLGDVDGDGDLDALLANTMQFLPNADNQILYNDGNGRFRAGQTVGMGGTGVALLDSDGDGDLDVLVGGMMGGTEFRNDENGRFVSRPIAVSQAPESGASQFFFQTGDLNQDGLADALMAGCCGIGIAQGQGEMEYVAPVNRVLLGSDTGLVDSRQQLGTRGSEAIDLGDVDNDGDLDVFVGNTRSGGDIVYDREANEVWLNDGSGNFSNSGQELGRQRTYAVALGDVDGDGDLDALVGNEGEDELWLNDGSGRFRDSYQSWTRYETLTVFLVDLDEDGDLDAVTGHQATRRFAWWRQGLIWWNDGSGRFTQARQRLHYRPNAALGVGDVNGDGLPDIVTGALDKVTVWVNEGNGRFQRG